MDRFSSILLCVDVSARGFDAVDEGPPLEVLSAIAKARWARERTGARITVMSVLDVDGADPELLDLVRLRLEQHVVSRLESADVEVVVTHGRPFQEIIRQVLRTGNDLVIVGARKSSLVHRTLVGSTSLHLLRKCPCPVWVAPRRSEPGPRVVLSAVAIDELMPVVLDLSARVVKARGGQWHVFHCPEYPLEGGMRLRGANVDETEAYEAEVRKECWSALHKHADPLAKSIGVEPKFWMSEGLPSEQIGLAVRELGADLVVMGTVSKSMLAATIVGNTAEKVFNTTECSILAVKPEGFVTPVTLED